MRVLLLNPGYGQGFCKSARWFAKSRGRVQRHPDYLCVATAVLEKAGHECLCIDGAAENLSVDETRGVVERFKPDMVVIQTTTPSIYSDLSYARMCKDACGRDCLTVMVGPHVTAETVNTYDNDDNALDVIAKGEYDYTLRDLASGQSLDSVQGISYRQAGTIIHNDARPLIKNVDELPFPAWYHIDLRDYHDAGKLYPFITILGGRGCDGRCTFCLYPQVMYGQSYRPKSFELVVDEIEYDLSLFPNLKEFMFEDDTLTLRGYHQRLEMICKEILHRNLKIIWSANARADITDLSLLRLMKRAGCRMLCVGFEFGNQEMLNRVRKGIRLERMEKFARLCSEAEIRIHGCFMIGGPGETRETARQTIEFAKRLPIDTVQFSGVCAYPGTEYYQWAKHNDYLIPKDWPEWVDDNLEQRSIVSFPQLPADEINRLVDAGLREFYLRPRQMLTMARNIRSWSDARTKLYGLRAFFDYFRSAR